MMNRVDDSILAMMSKQLEYLNELPHAGKASMSSLKTFSKFREFLRQTPIAIDFSVIQVSWFSLKYCEVMQWVKNHLAFAVAALMAGDDVSVANNIDPIDISLDNDRGDDVATRHTVAIPFPSDGLILVDLARLLNAWIQRSSGKRS